MKYSIAVISSLAATVLAATGPLRITNTNFAVEQGKNFTVTWEGCDKDCTISLQNGPPDNTKDVKVLTTTGSGGSFPFTPNATLPSDKYNFQIKNPAGEINYSKQFDYVGTGAAPPNPASSDLTSSTTDPMSSSTISPNITSSTTTTSSSTAPAKTPTSSTKSGEGARATPMALIAGAIAAMAFLG